MAAYKQCKCGRAYSKSEWERLPVVGHQLTDDEEGQYDLEMRNCTCGSTLGVERKTHDARGQSLMGLGKLSLKVTDSPAFKAWFRDSKVVDSKGNPLVVYHGSRRPDRIGSKFLKSRATSGPMPYFTDSPELAGKYATGKQDTSLEPPSSYGEWYKMKYGRITVPIERAWYLLTPERRAEISAKLPHVVYPDDGSAYDGKYTLDPVKFGLSDKGHWDHTIREKRGDVLRAAVDIWLDSGSLFDSEELFLKVLELGGAKGLFTYDTPHAEFPGILPVYLSIQKPVESLRVPPEVIAALEKTSRRQRPIPEGRYGADQWDKRVQDPRTWIDRLSEKLADPTASYAWTTIPDWVTKTLASLGYDGIQDFSGKGGGDQHTVWIPFEPTQIKSAVGNRGAFDLKDPNILHGFGAASRWMRTPGGR